jgi:uridine phosphorylase
VSFPNFPDKHRQTALFTPAQYVEYLRSIGRLDPTPVPERILLCYQRSLYEHILRTERIQLAAEELRTRRLIAIPRTEGRVAVLGNLGFGAPAAAGAIEHYIALGASKFVAIGTAGTLQPSCRMGDVIVCERALRDEGLSHHYLGSTRFAEASKDLTQRLCAALDARGTPYITGASWTTDALFRETVAEVRRYQADGILCVEMEAAALFAVGAYRSIQVACVFVASDSLADAVWQPHWHSDAVSQGLAASYEVALAALSAS